MPPQVTAAPGYCASTDWGNDIRTTEESFAAYIQLNWSGDVSGMPANHAHGRSLREKRMSPPRQRAFLYDRTMWLAPAKKSWSYRLKMPMAT